MSNQNLEEQRHSLAHLLAAAVLELYPDALRTIGPAIDDGFYYDFDNLSIGTDDLRKIEKRMKRLLPSWKTFDGQEVSESEAREAFRSNPYKLELIDEIIAKGEKITLYTSGNFVDLCRGGHSSEMNKIDPESFKLDRVAGAYWRGDEKRKMLTRIYGVAFDSKTELERFEQMRKDAKERDHRKIGKELDLFTFSDLVGSGLPLFTPRGTLMRDLIIEKIQTLQKNFGYEKVTIPHITKKALYETSGHWDKFGDELFKVHGKKENDDFVMKPMNCPHHTQIYAAQPRSYKDLPLRYMESTMVYRDEQAGELLGLSRVRSITQDDGHVFCTPDQIKTEVKNIVSVINDFYTSVDMLKPGQYWVSLSVRDPKTPEEYLGDGSKWDAAEAALEEIAKEENLPYKRVEGEAAFYGPKLDFQFTDAIGREWQLGTAQLDFQMPERFGLEYTDSDGERKTPVMIHRAVAGSLERFMAVMIEHFAGNFPLWLAPTQVSVIPIGDDHVEFAQKIHSALTEKGLRADINITNDGFGKKVRKAKKFKIPYFLIIGDKEVADGNITVESRDDGNLGRMTIEEIVEKLSKENN
ncbi:threonine--tRNA ligase [Candidatus Wolfebacteria bacterium]|nr:MAG: threonine--tRNA ligase [Candidatus Wolfebacteria bacterium]